MRGVSGIIATNYGSKMYEVVYLAGGRGCISTAYFYEIRKRARLEDLKHLTTCEDCDLPTEYMEF